VKVLSESFGVQLAVKFNLFDCCRMVHLKHLVWSSSFMLAGAAWANVVGPDTQNFNSTPDGLDFVTVESSEVLRPGVVNLGLFLNYAANTLPEFPEEGNASAKGKLKDRTLGADFNMAVGIFKNFEFGLSLPHILSQQIVESTDELHGQFGKTGTTEIRPMMKLRLIGNDVQGLAVMTSAGFNMIEGNPWVGEGAAPILNFVLAADTEVGHGFAFGGNLGYRKRSRGEAITNAPVKPVGSQYIASVAASVLLSSIKSRLIAEVYGSKPAGTEDTLGTRSASSAEGLLGLKHTATDALSLHVGGAAGLSKGTASPDWRVYAGLNYTLGPMFSKAQPHDVVRKKKKPSLKTPAPARDVANQVPDREETVEDPVGQEGNPFSGTPTYGQETFILNNVMFAFDEDRVVLPGTKKILQDLKDYLQKAPEFKHLSIDGHTDFIGSDSYNLGLSQRRADTIKRYLVEALHLDAARITTMGYGESRPIADNGNFQGRQRNRRVEFKITR
jgi:outer membrane protein OmpA-like peptidoglycan-associated protein